MKTRISLAAPFLAATISLAAAPISWSQTILIAGWNFNAAAVADKFTPTAGTGSLTTNWIAANLGDTTGTPVNMMDGDVAGRDLGLINGGTTGAAANEGRWLQFEVSTVGLNGLNMTYAGRTTATALRDLTWSYSTNGTDFTILQSVDHVTLFGTGTYGLVTLDLSSIAALNDQPQVFIRGTLATLTGQSEPQASGSNRFDNVQITAIPEPSTYAALFGLAALGATMVLRRRRSS